MKQVNGRANYITREGYERVLGLYQRLVEIELPDLLLKMRGSIHENFAAEQARRDHAVLEARIRALKPVVESPVFIDDLTISVEYVDIGAAVSIEDVESADVETYRIVGEVETDPSRGYISWLSPLAQSLIGRKKGEVVNFQPPFGLESTRLRVILIERAFGPIGPTSES